MAIVPITINTGENALKIYAEVANINAFVNETLVGDEATLAVEDVVGVSGYERRRFPGDTEPIQVLTSERTVLKNLSRKPGRTLPGKTFRLVSLDENDQPIHDRTFTYTGTWRELVQWLRGQVTNKTYLYNHTGGTPVVLSSAVP